jgi:hypothetical protein
LGGEKKSRIEMKEAYLAEAKLRKYKSNMETRFNKRDNSKVFTEVASYPMKFLMMRTTDKILFDYQRKLTKEI